MTGEREGVVKYHLAFTPGPAPTSQQLASLERCRRALFDNDLIGQKPDRYDGLGYGNVSQRHPGGFLVTGTQTSGTRDLPPSGYSLVTGWDFQGNALAAQGETPPSSEALTHAAVYDAAAHVNFVLHIHSPVLWHAARASGLPGTPPDVAYGTPAMARAVADIVARADDPGLMVMGGHPDGLIAFGSVLTDTAELLLKRARGL